MLPRLHPDNSQHQIDLSHLTGFLAEILDYPDERLDAKIKDDVTKVVNNLKFIKVNLNYLADAVLHKHKSATYANEHDRSNGVVRDFDGTSIHIFTYDDADKAKADLYDLITQFEEAIRLMRDKGKLLHFAKSIEYDRDKGCIEARVIRALIFAAKFKDDDLLDLDELFLECSETYQFNQHSVLINRCNTLFFFKSYFGLKCNHKINARETVTRVITPELIEDYLEQLGQTKEDAEGEQEPLQIDYNKQENSAGLPIPSTSVSQPGQTVIKKKNFINACGAPEVFLNFINQFSVQALDEVLGKKDSYGKTMLLYAAEKQSEIGFIALINKVNPVALNDALVKQDRHGETALSWAAEKQSGAGFIALINKVSPVALNDALGKHKKGSSTALIWAAAAQSEAGFIASQ